METEVVDIHGRTVKGLWRAKRKFGFDWMEPEVGWEEADWFSDLERS